MLYYLSHLKIMFLSNIAKNRAKFIAKYFHNKRNDKQNKKVFVHIVLCFIAQNCAIGIVLRNMRKKNNYSKFSATNRKEKCHCVETLNTTVLSSGLRSQGSFID